MPVANQERQPPSLLLVRGQRRPIAKHTKPIISSLPTPMPLYQIVCIAVHFPEFVRPLSPVRRPSPSPVPHKGPRPPLGPPHHARRRRRPQHRVLGNNAAPPAHEEEAHKCIRVCWRVSRPTTPLLRLPHAPHSYWTLHCDTSPQTLRSLNNYMRRDPRVLRCTTLKLAEKVEDVARQAYKAAFSPKPRDLDV